MDLARSPHWQGSPIHISVEMANRAAGHRPQKAGVLSFIQLVAAAMIGVTIYVAVADWLQPPQRIAATQTQPAMPRPAAPVANMVNAKTANQRVDDFRPLLSLAEAEPTPALPFPLPKTYGIYAASGGQLTELETLPLRVPDHRVQLSAEINSPSPTTLAGDKVAFVVFRRDLVNHAPQTVAVRVVARVARAMRFAGGKPVVRAVESAWRIRSKAYEFKVSPVAGHPEMIVVRPAPDFVFPAGRYALVLGGTGFDFTVPGPVTDPAQCLEQADTLNGKVLSECANPGPRRQ